MSQQLASRPKVKHVSCDASTAEKSLQFLKKVLALEISHIVFLRGVFEEKEFSDRYVGDLHIKMLKDNKEDENVHLLIEWMKGCFDAIEKKYLKTVALSIHEIDRPRESPIESYTFAIGYKGDNGTLSVQRNGQEVSESFSENNLKSATINCLTRLCEAVEVLEVLPDEVVMNMELTYYDDVTPEDYEPDGFQASASRSSCPAEEVAGLDTKFHQLRVKVYTRQFADLRSQSSTTSLHQRPAETSVISVCSSVSAPPAASVGVVSPTVRKTKMSAKAPSSVVKERNGMSSTTSTVDYTSIQDVLASSHHAGGDAARMLAKNSEKVEAGRSGKGNAQLTSCSRNLIGSAGPDEEADIAESVSSMLIDENEAETGRFTGRPKEKKNRGKTTAKRKARVDSPPLVAKSKSSDNVKSAKRARK